MLNMACLATESRVARSKLNYNTFQIEQMRSYADPESFVRGNPNFDNVFLYVFFI